MDKGRFVLTWWICSWKTEIITHLGKEWYDTLSESAIETINHVKWKVWSDNQKQWLIDDFKSWKPSEFHIQNIDRQIKKEAFIELETITFLDRWLLDYHAFCLLRDLPISEWMQRVFSTRAKYDKVFHCDTLPLFDSRGWSGRIIDETLARRMWELCREVYEAAGYDLIDVPVFWPNWEILPVNQRAEFVLENI